MKQIKNSEYEEFQKYLHNKNNGRMLTPDGLRLICQANDGIFYTKSDGN